MRQGMMRWAGAPALGVGTLIVGLTMASGQAARAGDAAGLLCQREEVAQVLEREIRTRDYYAVADFSTTVERPTLDPQVVHCTVGVVRCLDQCAWWPWTRSPIVQVYGYRLRLANRRFTVVFDAEGPLPPAMASTVATPAPAGATAFPTSAARASR